MEKVLLTIDQKKGLDRLKSLGLSFEKSLAYMRSNATSSPKIGLLNYLSPEKIAFAMLGHYELVGAKVGNWYYDKENETYHKILSIDEDIANVYCFDSGLESTSFVEEIINEETEVTNPLTIVFLELNRTSLSIENGDIFVIINGEVIHVNNEEDIQAAKTYVTTGDVVSFIPHENQLSLSTC